LNEYPREVLLEWGPSSPWQDALQFSPGDLNNEDNFHAFILDAGLLHGIIEWSQTLQWPVAQHADDPGISQFELVSHFVHCFGMALPEVASRAKGYPIYADKVRDKEYDCLPATGAGAVRFLQLAMRHIESTMGIQIFPVGHLTRRPFFEASWFWCFGQWIFGASAPARDFTPHATFSFINFYYWFDVSGALWAG